LNLSFIVCFEQIVLNYKEFEFGTFLASLLALIVETLPKIYLTSVKIKNEIIDQLKLKFEQDTVNFLKAHLYRARM